jgi:hypothetical protein
MSTTAALQNAVRFGLTAYPDGVIWYVPYALGVRAPYDKPAEGTPEDAYNQAYGHGAYDASVRVGLGGLAAGAILGVIGTLLLSRSSSGRDHRRRRFRR